ncbi:MAG: apolipoprotein N-acyltransferase [Pseudomonadota bacterium]
MSDEKISHGPGFLTSIHEAVARTTGLTGLLFSALIGAFAALAFAPFHISPALAVAFVGLVWMLDGTRGRKRWGRAMFARGWAFGYGYFLISMYWTALPFLVEPERHAVFIWMPLIALPGGMALIWGAACAMAGAFWSSSPSRIFIFGIFFALAELVRGHLFGGFPWNLPGTTWIPGGAISQAASIGGVYWLTLLTVIVMAAPAALVDTRKHGKLLFRAIPSVIAVTLLAFGFTWGSQRLTDEPIMTERSVILMDAGVPQAEKFDQYRTTLARYSQFLREVPSETGDILIWPEGALPSYLLQDTTALDQISGFLGPRTLITGTPRSDGTGERQLFYNSLAVFQMDTAGADLVALYDKHRLVPFGELAATEIIPFGENISGILPDAIQRMARSGFTPGAQMSVLYPEQVPAFIPLICYEGLFPELTRQAEPRVENAEWIVVISNDAWFGVGLGPAQHYAQNRYRSIETGLPMARVATRGISAVVDAFGREVARGAPVADDPTGWRSSIIRSPLPAKTERPPYARFGSIFFWITMTVCIILAFLTWRR